MPAVTYMLHLPLPTAAPPRVRRTGRAVVLEPLDAARHGADLAHAWALSEPAAWDYLFAERPADAAAAAALAAALVSDTAAHQYAVLVGGRACGSLAYMRIDADNGVLELGHVNFTSPLLRRTRAATEAVGLLLAAAFEAGFRRVEWKCDTRNAPSVRAAERHGFSAEGTFRQHMVVKSRLRDTAWFAMLRGVEWPRAREALARWLGDANHDANGRQRATLEETRRALVLSASCDS